jgi:hypothetical protein
MYNPSEPSGKVEMSEIFALTAADMAALADRHPAAGGEQSFLAVGVPDGISSTALEARLARFLDAFALNRGLSDVLSTASALPGPASIRAALDSETAWRDIAERYGLFSGSQIADLAGSRSGNRSEYASAMRRDGRIVGVLRAGRLLFPAFQFGPQGRPVTIMKDVIGAFRGSEWSDESIILWCTAPNGYLEGREPASELADQPALVLDAALNAAAEW